MAPKTVEEKCTRPEKRCSTPRRYTTPIERVPKPTMMATCGHIAKQVGAKEVEKWGNIALSGSPNPHPIEPKKTDALEHKWWDSGTTLGWQCSVRMCFAIDSWTGKVQWESWIFASNRTWRRPSYRGKSYLHEAAYKAYGNQNKRGNGTVVTNGESRRLLRGWRLMRRARPEDSQSEVRNVTKYGTRKPVLVKNLALKRMC